MDCWLFAGQGNSADTGAAVDDAAIGPSETAELAEEPEQAAKAKFGSMINLNDSSGC